MGLFYPAAVDFSLNIEEANGSIILAVGITRLVSTAVVQNAVVEQVGRIAIRLIECNAPPVAFIRSGCVAIVVGIAPFRVIFQGGKNNLFFRCSVGYESPVHINAAVILEEFDNDSWHNG